MDHPSPEFFQGAEEFILISIWETPLVILMNKLSQILLGDQNMVQGEAGITCHCFFGRCRKRTCSCKKTNKRCIYAYSCLYCSLHGIVRFHEPSHEPSDLAPATRYLDKAFHMLDQARIISQKHFIHTYKLVNILTSLAQVFEGKNQFDSAFNHYLDARNLAQRVDPDTKI
ncbi:hypothetical protein ACFE04_019877 [Oxalis oulophora]